MERDGIECNGTGYHSTEARIQEREEMKKMRSYCNTYSAV
jgi:hypothetical protein